MCPTVGTMTDWPFDGALSGIRVLDLSRVLAGPVCTQLLADLGADVIKVERPGVGDDTRRWGPPWLRTPDGTPTEEASYYLSTNRGKRSVAIDIGTDRGVALIKDLAAVSDIVVENFKVGSLAAKGLGYDDLAAVRANIIYASITGFGQDGPMADQPGYDYLAQALGGMMSINGRPDGEPGAGPLRVGVAVADLATGLYATIGILGALHHRDRTGVGQHIDIGLLDSQLSFLANQALNYLVSGTPPTRSGEWHPNLAPYQPFDVADGRVVIAVGNNSQFATLMEWLDISEFIDDPRFIDNADRNHHRVELAGLIQGALRSRQRRVVVLELPARGVPAATINDIGEAFAEPQVKHRGGRIDLPHATAGSAPGVANPLHFSATPVTYRNGPPVLGEHTDEVLETVLGLDADARNLLRHQTVIT